jgi:hypothetical protein
LPRPAGFTKSTRTWDQTGHFGPWAREVVLNLAGPLAGPGLWRYHVDELKALLAMAPIWSCVGVRGRTPESMLAGLQEAPGFSRTIQAFHLSVAMPEEEDDIDAWNLLQEVVRCVRSDASCLLSSSWSPTLAVTLLHGGL